MSLKKQLESTIKVRGSISFREMESICVRSNKRVSNGERRLRESDKIESIKNKKNQIIGYRWVE